MAVLIKVVPVVVAMGGHACRLPRAWDHLARGLLPRPVFKACKVHRDLRLEVGKALYSVPKDYIGSRWTCAPTRGW